MSKPSKRAGAPEIPDDVLMISYRVLLAGSGWEQPGLADHKEAVHELLLVLLERGWTICPSASCILPGTRHGCLGLNATPKAGNLPPGGVA